jgi:hypothetical protein
MADGNPFLVISAALWLVSLLLLANRFPLVRSSTLLQPWCWACGALVLVAVTDLMLLIAPGVSPETVRLLRYVATVATLCPIVAVFGAKRPQSHSWKFIVLSLWLVLVLPALEEYFLHRGRSPDLHGIRMVFLWILLVLGLGNYLATRFALSAGLIACAQSLLLLRTLGLFGLEDSGWTPLSASSANLSASCATLLAIGLSRKGPGDYRSLRVEDQLWLRFRDAFGAVWALRVADRINAMGRKRGWPMRMRWNGVDDGDALVDGPAERQARREFRLALRMLLRSFGCAPSPRRTDVSGVADISTSPD